MGRLVDRLNPARALRGGLLVTATMMAALAVVGGSWPALAALLAVAGAANALIDPAVNRILTRHVDAARLGRVIGVKQAGVPACTLLSGAAIPLVASPLGWRWVFGLAALLTVVVRAMVTDLNPGQELRRRSDARSRGPTRVEVAAVTIAATSCNALVAFAFEGAHIAGIGAGLVGTLAVLGGAVAIVARVALGRRADTSDADPLRTVVLLLVGATGLFLLLATERSVVFACSMPLAYGMGLGWQALLFTALLRRHPDASGVVTGVANASMFGGGVLGPIAFGVVAHLTSFSVAWVAMASLLVIAAVLLAATSRQPETDLEEIVVR
jgi:predicted MFS family arabinose efflux permease